jgi:hypothetical protein
MKKILVLFSLMATLALAMPAMAALVDFEGYPSGTIITDQYVDLGVLFSGIDSDPPPRTHEYVDLYGKVLRSHNWYDAMVITFVNPDNPAAARPVQIIEFDNPIDTEVDYIQVEVYDVDDVLIYSYLSTSPEHVAIDLGLPSASYMILDDDQDTAYVIDNLYFDIWSTPTGNSSWSQIKGLY